MTIQERVFRDADARREADVETMDLVASLYRVFAERHEPVARVKYLLGRLLYRLEEHFADQEASGLFVDLSRQTQAADIERLRHEHAELIEQLKRLADMAGNGNLAPEDWRRLEHEFREFGTRWCHHQWCETTTLMEAHERMRR
jgi:iron-sulfur cluster repair protein YtfE (RIC family)